MTHVASFVFNPFQENTYVLYDDTNQCIIVDPGCYTPAEKKELSDFISNNDLKPVKCINTHCHIDHILGNQYILDTYGLKPEIPQDELPLLEAAPQYGKMWGFEMEPSPQPERFINKGEAIRFGNTELEVLYTPGHSPGHITLYCKDDGFVISGDVLFLQSIGRTDLPGGDHQTLIHSIKTVLLPLGDDIKVYSGHGPQTTIGFEKKNNPFLNEYAY